MLTVLSNRVGDSAILLSIAAIIYKGRHNFIFMSGVDDIILLLIILASFTKRAQIPFSAWLPAAIAAPTPVSALVHSSTLVTAGVYLLLRFNFLIRGRSLLNICFVMGVMTLVMAGLAANFEMDLKKVIALSTLSQLGVIIIIIGLGLPTLAFFHLIMHALFKSTLFICAGFIIHNLYGRQESRLSMGFLNSSPIIISVFCCTNIALCGLPFMSGFYSKDLILEKFLSLPFSYLMIFFVFVGTGFTVSYTFRFIYNININKNKDSVCVISSDIKYVLIICSLVLFLLSIFSGFFYSWFFFYAREIITLWSFEKYFIGFVCFSFFFVFYLLSVSKYKKKYSNLLSWLSSNMIFMPFIRSFFLNKPFLRGSIIRLKIFDKGWVEFRGPLGLKKYFISVSGYSQLIQLVLSVNFYFLRAFFFVLVMFFMF